MKRFLTGLTATALCFSACAFSACKEDDYLLKETKVYAVSNDIYDMAVEIKSASVSIAKGDFCVESNLKHLTVTDENGFLRIEENGDGARRSNEGVVYIYVPEVTLGSVEIQTGAGKVDVEYLSAQNLVCNLGAGATRFSELYVRDNAEINGGTSKIDIVNGALHNLTMNLGVGECAFTGKLTGDNVISCGVGALKLALSGLKTSYRLQIDTGIGGAKVDGEPVADGAMLGEGDNFVDISGGVGEVTVSFIGNADKLTE